MNQHRIKLNRKTRLEATRVSLLEFARTKGSKDRVRRKRRNRGVKVEEHQQLHNVAKSNAVTFGSTGAGLSVVNKDVRETLLKQPKRLGAELVGAIKKAPGYALKDAKTAAGIGLGLEGLRRIKQRLRNRTQR